MDNRIIELCTEALAALAQAIADKLNTYDALLAENAANETQIDDQWDAVEHGPIMARYNEAGNIIATIARALAPCYAPLADVMREGQ